MTHKPFKTIEEQLVILQNKGLIINDIDAAKTALTELNYYRLSGYSLTLRKNDKFYKGTTFDDVMQVYLFDRDLKFLLLELLEDIEISLRTHLGYMLGQYDIDPNAPIAYFDEKYYASPEICESILKEIRSAIQDSNNEAFVKHHRTKYNGALPAWAMVETLSFGKASKLFSSLRVDLQKQICKEYYDGRRHTIMNNWFESLVVLRNMCAHKARIINRGITYQPSFSKDENAYFISQGYNSDQIGNRLFFRLIIIGRISPDPYARQRIVDGIKTLCKRYPFVNLKHYGFKPNWEEILHHLLP